MENVVTFVWIYKMIKRCVAHRLMVCHKRSNAMNMKTTLVGTFLHIVSVNSKCTSYIYQKDHIQTDGVHMGLSIWNTMCVLSYSCHKRMVRGFTCCDPHRARNKNSIPRYTLYTTIFTAIQTEVCFLSPYGTCSNACTFFIAFLNLNQYFI